MKILTWYSKTSLLKLNVAAFVLGCLGGLALWKLGAVLSCSQCVHAVVEIISPFGKILVNLLKMVVFPVIFLSLVTGASSVRLKQFGRVGVFAFAWYLATSLLASVWGVAMALASSPRLDNATELAHSMIDRADSMRTDATTMGFSLLDIVYGMFKNPVEALAKGDFLAVIIFAILFGLAAHVVLASSKDPATRNQITNLLDSAEAMLKVVFKLTDWMMRYFPIGVFALTLGIFATFGIPLLTSYLQVAGCVIIGILTMLFACYPLLIALFCRENPYRILWKLREPLLTAFITRSSAATLPVSLQTASRELHVKSELSGFTLSLGATINMDGVCIHLPVFAILAANMFGIPLGMQQLVVITCTVFFASLGAGSVPGGSIFLLFMVLDSLHLTAEQTSLIVALALGINPLLDMFETACNVAGDHVATYVIGKSMGMISKARPVAADPMPEYKE